MCRAQMPRTTQATRTYLVLAKPNVIINEPGSGGWGLQEVTLPVERVATTTPRPYGTLDAPSEMLPLVPG